MFDNPFSMTVAIVLIVCIASVLRSKYGVRRNRHGDAPPVRDPDTARMREELQQLRQRVAVLERIATENDRGANLDREIEALRHRD